MPLRAKGRAHLALTALVWLTLFAARPLTQALQTPMLGVHPSREGVHP